MDSYLELDDKVFGRMKERREIVEKRSEQLIKAQESTAKLKALDLEKGNILFLCKGIMQMKNTKRNTVLQYMF